MSLAVRQMLMAGVVGLIVVIVVVRLSRRGQLSFRYTVGWIGVASFGILAGLFVRMIQKRKKSNIVKESADLSSPATGCGTKRR